MTLMNRTPKKLVAGPSIAMVSFAFRFAFAVPSQCMYWPNNHTGCNWWLMSLWNVWKPNLLIYRFLFKVYLGGPFASFRALDLFHLMYPFALCLFDICMFKLTPLTRWYP